MSDCPKNIVTISLHKKNVAGPGGDWIRDFLITSRTRIRLSFPFGILYTRQQYRPLALLTSIQNAEWVENSVDSDVWSVLFAYLFQHLGL